MASVTLIFGGREEKTFELDRPKTVVGREEDCDVTIDNLGVSRKHCAFEKRGEAFVVLDVGSSNGTFCNGRRVREHFLNDGDEVVIGKFTLKFRNEAQAKTEGDDLEATVPDTMNTYVMDGDKIQAQLAKLRAAQQQGATEGGTAGDYARALAGGEEGAAAEIERRLHVVKAGLAISLFINILLLIILLVLVVWGAV